MVAPAKAAIDAPGVEVSENTLNDMVVTADRQNSFRADYVQSGIFRDSRLRDTPLMVSIMTRKLLDAQQARTLLDAVRTPLASPNRRSTMSSTAIWRSAVAANNFSNYRWNGSLPIVNLIDQPIKSKGRIEVLKGVAGLYYGFATPSGIVNLVTERPTQNALIRFEILGNSHGSIGSALMRRFSRVGVRVNAGTSLLENGVKRTSGERHFATGAIDWKPANDFEVLLDAEYIYKTITEPTEFALPAAVSGVITIPPLQSPSKNLGSKLMQAKGWETKLLARVNYDFAPSWRISAAIGQSYLTRDRSYSSSGSYNLLTGNGPVNVAMTSGNDYRNAIYRGSRF